MDWVHDKIGGRDKKTYLSDLVDVLELEVEHKAVRMIGPSKMLAIHKIEILTKKGKKVRIPKLCLAWDADKKEVNEETPCPYCKIDNNPPAIHVITNAIDREEQENKPEKTRPPSDKEKKVVEMRGYKCRVKEGKKSKSWTPVRLWEIRPSAGNKVSTLTKMNKVKLNGEVKVFPPNHPKYGFDMQVNFDPDQPGTDMYGVVKDDRTKITDEERKYLVWDLDVYKPETLDEAKREANSMSQRLASKADDDDDDDEKPKKKSKSGKSKKSTAEDEDWSEDEDFEDDEDEDKSAKKSKKKKVTKDEDEEEDEDDDVPWDDEEEDDGDDDDDPKASKKKAGKVDKAGKSKKKRSEPDEEDEPDEDDDVEDEEDDEGEDDEDEEDEKPVKKKKKVTKTEKVEKTKKKKPSDDEEEDDGEDGWGDDDDDEWDND